MPDADKINAIMERVKNMHLVSETDLTLAQHLDRLLVANDDDKSTARPMRMARTKETRGILFVDAAGAGKTTAIDRGLTKHPMLQSQRCGFRPFLFAEVPTDPTLKSMAARLLEKAGYNFERSQRTTSQLFDHLRELMERNGQIILWIDEAHDLITKDRDKILRATKSLMQGPNSVIVVMSGTEQLEDLVSTDSQVRRRFSIIKPPALEVGLDNEQLIKFFELMCNRAGLGPLNDPSLASRAFLAGRYQLGRVIEMFENGIERALWSEDDQVTLEHFGEAWFIQEGGEMLDNPFLVDDWQRIDPDKKAKERPAKVKKVG